MEVTRNGEVGWASTLNKNAIANQQACVPTKARPYLPEGQYHAGGRVVTLTRNRMAGLVRLVVARGGRAGSVYRTTVNPRQRTIAVQILGQQERDDENDLT